MQMKSIAVFCAASELIDKSYVDAARAVGALLGRQGAELVYGGARFGLMEAVARSAKENGAKITGVVPYILEERDRVSYILDEKINCNNLSDRKDIMLRRSGLLVALPGGIGTLDEIFHVVAAATIGYHDKRVVLYNVNGFWDGLVNVIAVMAEKGFIRSDLTDKLLVVDTLDGLEKVIKEF
jgi:uncharacterized protein (TIGR00730 family)